MNIQLKKSTTQRAVFPEKLGGLRKLMPELLKILEGGRENEWYAFVWLEEVKKQASICAITERTEESLDRGIVFRVVIDQVHYEKSTNQLKPDFLKKLAQDFRQELEEKISSSATKSYVPLSWNEELSSSLHSEFTTQLPEQLNFDSWVHFGARCDVLPEQTNLEQLRNAASSSRNQVLKKIVQISLM